MFILLTERGKLDTFATWKIIAIMTCSATADVRSVPQTTSLWDKKASSVMFKCYVDDR